MEASSQENQGDVRKVYISDSPVLEDNLEYKYVNVDIDEELGDNNLAENNPAPEESLTDTYIEDKEFPQTHFTEEDELAIEAEYQRNLQERLQKTTLDDSGEKETQIENEDHETPQQLSQEQESEDNYTYDALQKGKVRPDDEEDDTEHRIEKQNQEDEDDADLLEWNNPPSNPFGAPPDQEMPLDISHNTNNHQRQNLNNHHSDEDEKMVPQNFQQTNNKSRVSNNYQPAVNKTNPIARRQYSDTLSEGQTSNHQHNDDPYRMHLTNTHPPAGSQNYHQSQNHYQQQNSYNQSHPHENDYYYDENNQYAFHHQQQPLEPDFNHPQQMGWYGTDQDLSVLAMGPRNAPVMYMPNPTNQNEYSVITPQEMRHQYYMQQMTNGVESNHINLSQNGEENENGVHLKGKKAVVAPKPVKPSPNFIEKNRHRAEGQYSAKPGYSDRLIQKKHEQELMKEWAPGMIIPRKKAASADDLGRVANAEDMGSPEDMWSKRARDLANAKQAKLSNKGKKASSKSTSLARYPSDNSLSKKLKIPPINKKQQQQRTYANGHQTAPQGQWVNDNQVYQLPNQTIPMISPTMQLSSNGYIYQPQVNFQPVAAPVQQPYVLAYPQETRIEYGSPYGPVNYSPVMGPQPVVLTSPQLSQGPPSGGYHHHTRRGDMNYPNQVPHPPEQPAYQYQQPPSNQMYQTTYQPQPDSLNSSLYSQPPGKQPMYDYSGYLNSSNKKPPYNPGKPAPNEAEHRSYDVSPYSSPHPPLSDGTPSHHKTTKKPPLNPYAAIPPIHPIKVSQGSAVSDDSGSYMQAYQKEKEKAERLQKGPTYKVYTLKDYKNLQYDIRRGGLGPAQDPEVMKEKNEIRKKQLEYAKEVVQTEMKKPHPSPRRQSTDDVQTISGRQLAIEYAKHIPKPGQQNSTPQTTSPTHSSPEKISALVPLAHPKRQEKAEPTTWVRPSNSVQPAMQPLSQVELDDLEDLQRRHEEERRAVAEIQYKMQQTA